MNYITIVAPTYEEAVRMARDQYGDRIRIHSRKDVVAKGFLGIGRTKHCELTCFLSGDETPVAKAKPQSEAASKIEHAKPQPDPEEERDMKRFEQEAKTPNPEAKNVEVQLEETAELVPPSETTETKEPEEQVVPEPQEMAVPSEPVEEESAPADPLLPLEEHARKLLAKNDFSEGYINWIVKDLRAQLEPALPAVPSKNEFELLIVDRIVGSVDIDHNSQLHPPKIFALFGPTGVGKTTTIAKIAAIYGTLPPEEIRKKVKIITMDSFRVGAYEQIESFGKALDIPVMRADDEEQFFSALEQSSDAELILVDTIGRSPRDNELNVKLQTMLSVPDRKTIRCYLAVSASMKKIDIDKVFEQFRMFNISSVIVTKADETQTIGNILSICHDRRVPLLFITDGQMVPRDIHKASSAFVLSLLRGFSMDFNSLWNTQIGSDE